LVWVVCHYGGGGVGRIVTSEQIARGKKTVVYETLYCDCLNSSSTTTPWNPKQG